MINISIADRINILSHEYPEWVNVLRACVLVAKKTGSSRIAGSWIYSELREQNAPFLPNNLRLLVRSGILQKVGDSTRGGHRAYYIILDIENLEKVLDLDTTRKSTVSVPVYVNLVSCGTPNMSDAHIDSHMEIDTRLARPGYEYYLVRADGDSMNLEGINSGDLVLVRRQSHADIGQKVVAYVSDGMTIKELRRSGDRMVLVPRSTKAEYLPVEIPKGEDLRIQGIVVATIPNFQNHDKH